MRAWRLERLGGKLALKDIHMPEVRPGSALIKIKATSLASYLKSYVEGKLSIYNPPAAEFTIGTNAVGVVEAVGREVRHITPGQQVMISPLYVARENVEDPWQILIGHTSIGAAAGSLLADWPDGTLAEYALMPVETITPADSLEQYNVAQLAVLSRFIVSFGGLLRGRLAAGETLIVTGATGAFGTAAVLLGVAMGAARVIAAGRNVASLDALARAAGPRISTVALTGDVQADARSLRAAAGGGAHIAFDMVGQAKDPHATLAALHSLYRGGRLVLMGSMTADLPVPYTQLMLSNLEIIGQFMYPLSAYRRLLDLLRSGLLNITAIRPRVYPLVALPEAMDAAATAGNLECVVVQPGA